jgi:hypothetical protein
MVIKLCGCTVLARVLVVSLGFTVDFAVRKVADLGREEIKHLEGTLAASHLLG